jgi:hypothetical protein
VCSWPCRRAMAGLWREEKTRGRAAPAQGRRTDTRASMQSARRGDLAGRSCPRRWAPDTRMARPPPFRHGRDRCTLQISRQNAGLMGLAAWSAASVSSRVGSVVAPVEVTDDLMPGVVLPDARAAHGIPTQ